MKKHFDNYDYVENHEQYLKELELMNEAMEKLKDKIVTWHGKITYDEHKHTLESLIEGNKRCKRGGWIR